MILSPSVLIVEDEPDVVRAFNELLSTPQSTWDATQLVPSFRPQVVTCGSDAEDRLAQASNDLWPFDVLLLDLNLPEREGDLVASPKVGFLVGNYAASHPFACGSVVVASQLDKRPLIREALKSFAADYVFKSEGPEEIYRSVVAAYQKGRARWENEWAEVRRRHIESRQLAAACARVADRMARAVSDHTGEALSKVADLVRLIEDRYQLRIEQDRDDPVCAAVRRVEQAILETARACAVESRQWDPIRQNAEPINLAEAVEGAVRGCAPGLACYRVRWVPEADRRVGPVPTFPLDVKFVLDELIVSGVEAHAGQENDEPRLRTQVTRNDSGGVEIRVADQGLPIDIDTCEQINRGVEFEPDDRDSSRERAFGLSLARRVAHEFGARLTVTPDPTGNTVTLTLPVTTTS